MASATPDLRLPSWPVAIVHHCPLTGTKLYYMVTEAHVFVCVNNLHKWNSTESHLRLLSCESNALAITPPAHTHTHTQALLFGCLLIINMIEILCTCLLPVLLTGGARHPAAYHGCQRCPTVHSVWPSATWQPHECAQSYTGKVSASLVVVIPLMTFTTQSCIPPGLLNRVPALLGQRRECRLCWVAGNTGSHVACEVP